MLFQNFECNTEFWRYFPSTLLFSVVPCFSCQCCYLPAIVISVGVTTACLLTIPFLLFAPFLFDRRSPRHCYEDDVRWRLARRHSSTSRFVQSALLLRSLTYKSKGHASVVSCNQKPHVLATDELRSVCASAEWFKSSDVAAKRMFGIQFWTKSSRIF